MTVAGTKQMEVPGLAGAVAEACGGPVVHVERRRSEYSTSFAIDDVTATMADGTSAEFVLKSLDSSNMLSSASGVRPAFLHDPAREVFVYRSVLPGAGMGTAMFHAVLHDPDFDRRWLLLEKVPGVELYQVGDRDVWRQVARWLARLHAHFAAAVPVHRSLLRYDGELYRMWPDRALGFAAGDKGAAALAWLAGNWEELVEALVALPVTFVHGELYASNVLCASDVLCAEDHRGTRVCPVDWEMAGTGPGLLDLAALTSGWDDDDVDLIARAYQEELTARGVAVNGPDLRRGLDDCRLLLAVQWLGWAPGWVAPDEHAQDWLGLAVRLAEERGW